MLVLSRKIGESIVIGDDVVVTVRETHGGRIRLAIEAPSGRVGAATRADRKPSLPRRANGDRLR